MILLLLACEPQPRALFEREVAPVFEARCSDGACHGVNGDEVDRALFFLDTDASGRLTDLDRAYADSKRIINTEEDPRFSTLLRKPMARAFGGLPHYGGENFLSWDDPAVTAILAWIEAESDGGEGDELLSAEEARFADAVEPLLAARGCMQGACHGADVAVPFRLDPGIDNTRSKAMSRANYLESLRMLALDGQPDQSRLLRKGLPLERGGVLHKGGNTTFFFDPDDPTIAAITDWACAERSARLGGACGDEVEGFYYVRGPILQEDIWSLDAYAEGTTVCWSEDQSCLDGPGDLRDPAVDPTGRTLAFAWRRPEDAGHHIWTLDRATGALTQRTDGDWSDRDPTFGPDGAIWFVSDRAGTRADSGGPDADLWSIDASGALARRTWTPHVERKPVFLVTGTEAGGEVLFTALREVFPGQALAHPFRFPPDLSTEYHQHFGITPDEDLFWDMVELPDGRYAVVVGELAEVWEGGALAVVDRNFGPEIPDFSSPALPFYADPLTRLDLGFCRDPAPLPDGSLLAACADPAEATPTFRIERIALAESPDGSGPVVSAREVLLEGGVRDPAPVYVRQPAPTAEPRWDPDAETGFIRHNGLPLIDAILADLPPSGEKVVREDIAAVRLVQALDAEPRLPVPAEDIRCEAPYADSAGLSGMMPSRVLAELPLAADGTFQAELPAGLPFRLQALDAAGRMVGEPHNRWFYVAPGQVLPQGLPATSAAFYEARCAACHGAQDGDPDHAFTEPDVLTTASLTLSRYEDQNPRLPISPPEVGEATAIRVDWQADVRPLMTGCAACHGAEDPAAGLSLTDAPTAWYDDAYESLYAAGLVYPGQARRSALYEKLSGEELDAAETLAEPGLRHGDLNDEDLATIARWLDLGATWSAP